MHPQRKKRLFFIVFISTGSAVALLLVLFALKQNMNFYLTPTQISKGEAPKHQIFRIGGIVMPHSIHHIKKSLEVTFILTDGKHAMTVFYNGLLPDLFGPNQGVVASGEINQKNIFMADQVLAKHGATYMPPGISRSVTQ